MCLPKPKRDPAIDELAKLQKAQVAEQEAAIAADITEEKQEDKDLAITERQGMKMRRRGGGRGRRRTMLAGGQGYEGRFGTGRFG
tara:strand:+ start:600 stop:854 length:255 start_codon:yes stop_codon:yes gene_type:complete